MAFIRNVDKLIEGLENKFFTEARAKAALAPELAAEESARLAGDSAEAAARESADNALDARLDVIEGSGEGSVAKAEQDAKDYADQKVAALVNSAPAVLDTLKELSDALGGDQNFATTVAGQIGAVDDKVDQEILDRQSGDNALDSRLDVLEQDPTTKSYVDGIQSALDSRLDIIEGADSVEGSVAKAEKDAKDYADGLVSAEQSARQSADSALSGRIAILELDPVTKTYVDGVKSNLQGQITQEISDRQSDVNAEESRAMSAESALDGRLDVLEQDPTTKAYVDQEVSAEESRAMSAESALDGRLDVLEQDPTTKSYVDGIQSALDSRLDVLESDPVTKSYVDSGVSNLQGQVNTEKGRIDAILSASTADKDSFAEIVSLINSIDTTNDNAFASYVLSNDAALAQEVSDRQSGDNALDLRLDVLEADPTTKSYVDGIKSSLDAQDLLMFKKDGSRNMEGNILFQTNGANNIGSAPTGVSILKNDYTNRPQHIIATGRVIGSRFDIQSFSNSANPTLSFGHSRGTEGTPSQSTHGSAAGIMQFFGMNELGASRLLGTLRVGVANNVSSTSACSSGWTFDLPSLVNNSATGRTVFQVASYAVGINVENSSGTHSTMFVVESDTPPSPLPAGYGTAGGGINCYSQLKVNAGLKVGYSAKSANYTLVSSDYIIAVSDLSSSKVMTLPSAVTMGAGKTYVIKDQSGAASQSNYIQIAPQAGQQIDGQNDYKIVMPYESVMLVSNGSHWFII